MDISEPLRLAPGPGNPRNSEGSFVTLADGRILFIYTRYTGESWSDHASADLVARVSSDGGRTWSAGDQLVVANEDGLNVMSVSLRRLHDGRIALFYLRKTVTADGLMDCRPYLRLSTDEARTWSEPRLCIASPGYFVLNNDRVIQLRSGRLLMPVALHRTWLHGRSPTDGRAIALMYYSDDAGQTWAEAPGWILPPQESRTGLQEPGVIELADGRIYAWFRTDRGCQYQAFSHDGGINWGPAVPAWQFPSPASPLSMKRHPAGDRLYAVWNDKDPRWSLPPSQPSSWHRTPLVMAVSTDEGKAWHGHWLLETDPARGYCYIAMHFLADDNALLLAYCCGGADGTSTLQETSIKRIRLASPA